MSSPGLLAFKTVSELNNWAVILLQKANYTDAILCLKQAVALAQKEDAVVVTSSSSCCSSAQQQMPMTVPLSPPPSTERAIEVNAFAIFDQAFVTIPSMSQQQMDDESDNVSASITSDLTFSVLLYNTGLALHKKAMLQEISSRSLKIALEFYHRALIHINSQDSKVSSAEVLLLRLAILNNIGHIASSMQQHPYAMQCNLEIRKLMTARAFLLLPTLTNEYKFFGMNVLLNNDGRQFASAAPAA